MKSLVQQFYNPEFMPDNLNLAEFVQVIEKDETIRARIDEQVKSSPLVKLLEGDVPRPLTYEESIAIDDEIERYKQAITATRNRISGVLKQLDEIAYGYNGGEISFQLDISKRLHLRRAIKKAFGVTTDTITYSMYRAAVEAKRNVEKSEAKDYTNSKWKK